LALTTSRIYSRENPFGSFVIRGCQPSHFFRDIFGLNELTPDAVLEGIGSSHNILVDFIDEETGIRNVLAVGLAADATLCDIDEGESVAIWDASVDPLSRVFEGCASGKDNSTIAPTARMTFAPIRDMFMTASALSTMALTRITRVILFAFSLLKPRLLLST
jgi:hypothetical protein